MRTSLRSFAFLAWLATAPLAQNAVPCESGMIFDDGMAETTWGTVYTGPDTVSHLLSKFTPQTYPFRFASACVFMFSFEITESTLDVVIFDDDGMAGAPGTLLAASPLRLFHSPNGAWLTAEFECGSIGDGSAWIGVRYSASQNIAPGADRDNVHPFYSSGNGVDWLADYPVRAALMIRADGSQGNVQASAVPRNGSGVNTLCISADRPLIGSTWTARVAHDFLALQTFVQIRRRPASGVFLSGGEVLLDRSSPAVFTSMVTSDPIDSQDVHSAPIPPDIGLIGVSLSAQGGIRVQGSATFCNAYDLTIGCQ